MIQSALGEAPRARPQPAASVRLASFLDDWLPEQFRGLCTADPEACKVPCSLLLQLGADTWWLGVDNRVLSIQELDMPRPALLHLEASVETFLKLVIEAEQGPGALNPALRLLQIGENSLRDVQGIVGAVRLLVADAEYTHELTLRTGAEHAEVTSTLRCELADLRRIQAGAVQPLDLFIGGKLRLEGDPQTAITLGSLFL